MMKPSNVKFPPGTKGGALTTKGKAQPKDDDYDDDEFDQPSPA
jgi:hypothetical protein